MFVVDWIPVSVAGGVRKAASGFLRYIEFRDQRTTHETARALDGFLRYVAHRDRTSPAGRIFGRDGRLTNADRRRLVDYVARSTEGLKPIWIRNKDGVLEDHQRAVYQLLLSPEDWRGLDLRRLAHVAMQQLDTDVGAGGVGPWFAAEHRNTERHHVHIVLAARREVAPGKFRTVIITPRRLQRMKDAIRLEVDRQRGLELEPRPALVANPHRRQLAARHELGVESAPRWQWVASAPKKARRQAARSRRIHGRRAIAATVLHLRQVARRYSERMQRELEREQLEAEREGWVR